MVDPAFWADEKVGVLPRDTRLLYIALWSQADDAGLLEADPRRIKAFAFRYDDRLKVHDVERWLWQLEKIGRIVRYQHRDRFFYCIRWFLRHQSIEKPRRSDIPRPPREILDSLDDKCRALLVARTADPSGEPTKPATSEYPLPDESGNGRVGVGEPSGSLPAEKRVVERKVEERSTVPTEPSAHAQTNGKARTNESELDRLRRLEQTTSDPLVRIAITRKREHLEQVAMQTAALRVAADQDEAAP